MRALPTKSWQTFYEKRTTPDSNNCCVYSSYSFPHPIERWKHNLSLFIGICFLSLLAFRHVLVNEIPDKNIHIFQSLFMKRAFTISFCVFECWMHLHQQIPDYCLCKWCCTTTTTTPNMSSFLSQFNGSNNKYFQNIPNIFGAPTKYIFFPLLSSLEAFSSQKF